MGEAERVREAYARRASVWQDDRYRSWMPGNLFIHQERERVVLDLLRRHGFLPLGERRILDVGCGPGKALLGFLLYGAQPQNLFGIDVLEDQIEIARTLGPHVSFQVGDATELPFEDESMDLALAFTSFSSMQDATTRQRVAREMQRVLRPSGAVVWYDFWLNFVNPDVRAIRMGEIEKLFEGWTVDARRVTPAPPVARVVAPRSWLACGVIAKVPFLRTHWLALVKRS